MAWRGATTFLERTATHGDPGACMNFRLARKPDQVLLVVAQTGKRPYSTMYPHGHAALRCRVRGVVESGRVSIYGGRACFGRVISLLLSCNAN